MFDDLREDHDRFWEGLTKWTKRRTGKDYIINVSVILLQHFV